MNIFISWSGDKSKKIASLLKTWLPSVLQAVKTFYSPDDIAKGKRWSNEISEKLQDTDFGILLVTQDNLNAPWILFEAGALSKNLANGRVCTFLFNVSDSDVQGPLSLFQNTKFDKNDVLKLINDINNYSGDKAIEPSVLKRVFTKMWPDFEKRVSKILREEEDSEENSISMKTEREILEESLEILRKVHYKHTHFGRVKFEFDGQAKVLFNKEDGNISFYDNDKEEYWLNLTDLPDTGRILDFIFQINGKGWCKSKHLREFLECLEELSDDYFDTNAQGAFCPFGNIMSIDWENKKITPMKTVEIDKE